jgi:hypothetical protein
MGSVSMGISLAGFGATGGTTLVDQACVRRLDAREFRAMGLTDVALALLCQSDANRRAVESTGHLCPGTSEPLARDPHDTPRLSDEQKYRDPLVRARMGLPPLDTTAATTPPRLPGRVASASAPSASVSAPAATEAPVAPPAPSAALPRALEEAADTTLPATAQPAAQATAPAMATPAAAVPAPAVPSPTPTSTSAANDTATGSGPSGTNALAYAVRIDQDITLAPLDEPVRSVMHLAAQSAKL